MRTNKVFFVKKLLCIICTLISFNCFSFTDFRKTTLNQLVKYSEEITIVDIIQVSPKKQSCGYLVDANVVDSLKGKESKRINFWIHQRSDVIDGMNRYLVFANTRKKIKKQCLASLNSVGGLTNQTMFPFWTEKYILANRQSFLTSAYGFYDPDEVVKSFKVHDDRIYAMADWEKVKVKIKQLLSSLEQ